MRMPLVLALWAATAITFVPHTAQALVTLTVSGSVGQSGEVHPKSAPLATNLMLTGGAGFVWDHIRPELGIVGAYGAIRAHRHNSIKYELRPMLRLSPPLIPLYLRLVVAGLNPFDRGRALAYGGGLGVNIRIGWFSIFGEAGVLPRYADKALHWVVEGRLGMGFRL